MDSKLLARIGAAAFVGLAGAMTLLQLREEPPARPASVSKVSVPEGDPLSAQIRACANMGERALSSPDCRAAWAEKRRRFLGVDHPEAYSALDDNAPPISPSDNEQRGEN